MHDQEYELDPNQRVRHEYDAYKAVNESSSHVIVCVCFDGGDSDSTMAGFPSRN